MRRRMNGELCVLLAHTAGRWSNVWCAQCAASAPDMGRTASAAEDLTELQACKSNLFASSFTLVCVKFHLHFDISVIPFYETWFSFATSLCMPGIGLMVRVVVLGSWDPEFKSPLAVELIPGGVDSACHPSEVGQICASLLVSCVRVVTHPGLYPIAKETA